MEAREITAAGQHAGRSTARDAARPRVGAARIFDFGSRGPGRGVWAGATLPGKLLVARRFLVLFLYLLL